MTEYTITQTELTEYEKREQEYVSRPIERITKERFVEMLEILPPMYWRTTNGIESFMMCELTIGDVTQQFARRGNEYFCKYVRALDRDTWISHAMIDEFISKPGNMSQEDQEKQNEFISNLPDEIYDILEEPE
jgi:hypothetical protein